MCDFCSLPLDEILSLPDVYGAIKSSGKPVLLWGMGDGAEKTAACLAAHGIAVSGVFASDGFVRGQSFLGFEVVTEAAAAEKFGDFTAVMSFALEGDKRSAAFSLAGRRELFCLPLCPFGGETDAAFIRRNDDKLSEVYSLLSDSSSRREFISLLSFGVTGRIQYTVPLPFSPPAEYVRHSGTHIDVGAYDGSTALGYAGMNPECKSIIAIEPDPSAFARLVKNAAGAECINAAASDRDGVSPFSAKGSRASSLGGDGSVRTVKLDTVCGYPSIAGRGADVRSVRIDGEGAEDAILSGGVNMIYSCRPCVCCAVYHRADDIYALPIWLRRQLPGCTFALERRPYIPSFDVFIYALPRKR